MVKAGTLLRIPIAQCFFLLALPAVLSGCFAFQPKTPVRYHNTDPNPVFFRGAQSNSYLCGDLEFTTAWEDFSWSRIKYRKGYVKPASFRVEVRNLGSAPVLIDPGNFTLQGPPGEAPGPAIDPEKVLLSIRADLENLEAEKARETASHRALALRDLDEETDSSTASPENREKRRAKYRAIREDHKGAMHDFAERARRLETDWRRWSDAALRKTTLGPGQLLHGMVAFALDRPFPGTLTLRHLDSAGVSFPSPCDMGRFVLETDETVPVSKQAPDPRRPEP